MVKYLKNLNESEFGENLGCGLTLVSVDVPWLSVLQDYHHKER